MRGPGLPAAGGRVPGRSPAATWRRRTQAAVQAAAIGERCRDRDLEAFARQQQGRVLLRQGQLEQGLALLDEAMVAAKAGEVSPVMTGLLYCGVIAGCQHVYAFDRAREWTAALSDWCQAQPQLVSFTGTCLAHRAEILQLGGSWPEAIAEAERAAERCRAHEREVAASAALPAGGDPPAARGLRRRRGGLPARQPAGHGAPARAGAAAPGPGRPAGGGQRHPPGGRRDGRRRWRAPGYLPAQVEIALAGGRSARSPSRLRASWRRRPPQLKSEVLGAIAAHARGSVRWPRTTRRRRCRRCARRSRSGSASARPTWRRACGVALGRACQALGDGEGARLEWQAAREVFERLGARPDLAVVAGAADGPASPAARPRAGPTA